MSTLRVTDTDALQGPLAAALPPAAAARLLHATQARRGDVLFVAAAAGGAAAAGAALGAVRLAAAAALEARGETVRGAGHAALWVEDFPLFEEDEERGAVLPVRACVQAGRADAATRRRAASHAPPVHGAALGG